MTCVVVPREADHTSAQINDLKTLTTPAAATAHRRDPSPACARCSQSPAVPAEPAFGVGGQRDVPAGGHPDAQRKRSTERVVCASEIV
jgi:hypothetical protein